jgi:hypothetical protein
MRVRAKEEKTNAAPIRPTPFRRRSPFRLGPVLGLFLALDVAILTMYVVANQGGETADPPESTADPSDADSAWANLGPQERCNRAVALVSFPNSWPLHCRWRQSQETLSGMAWPPPAGEAPWDNPRIEVYLTPSQSEADVAHAIAHEMGHMHHGREYARVEEWLAARRLPPDTEWTVWTED